MGLVKSTDITPVTEVVDGDPALSRSEVTKLEKKALSHFQHIDKNTVQLAVELCQLQNGGAHLQRGFPNFGEYIEHTFEGLNHNTARQLSREGEVIILLMRERPAEDLPGMTGVRSLAKIQKQFGNDVMLSVYDAAMESGRKITADTVLAAAKQLEIAKPPELESSEAQPIPVETDDMPVESEDEDRGEHPELQDRLGSLQDSIYAISDCLAEGDVKAALHGYDDVFKELENIKVELIRISFDAVDETKEVNP